MTTHVEGTPRRLKAALVGLGFDGRDSHHRIITGENYLMVGGSAETHAEILETLLRLDAELERLGRRLGDLPTSELAEVAWRIDSPELHAIALRMAAGLDRRGRSFHDSSADELTSLASLPD